MGDRHKQRSVIPKSAVNLKQEFKYITQNPTIMEGWMLDGNNASVLVSIRFLQHHHECFSDWEKQEMKVFWDFLDKLHNYTWQQIYDGSRKSDKAGLALTRIPKRNYPDGEFRKSLDEQIELFEFRVDQSKRVHGFRMKSLFYLCWLDKNHRICP